MELPTVVKSSDEKNQRNMQVNSVTVLSGATYNGDTYSGNVLELGGGFTIEKGGTANLTPRGDNSGGPAIKHGFK
ncbi:hypothetical protein ACYATO_08370 [Lactobacillaceae bacterium Melli_B3]